MHEITVPEIDIHVTKAGRSRINEMNFDHLEFGKYVSDHMFSAQYKNGIWHQAEIIPYRDISLAPTALCLHYGQTIFEGMKAFRMQNTLNESGRGDVSIFRMEKHFERINKSLDRMCMANVHEELFFESIKKLIKIDQEWVPDADGSSLYIRPFMIATEERFGVKESEEFLFIIFTGPVPKLFNKPLKVKVETEYVRAAKGGTGAAKCGGNYGGALYPTKIAKHEGYHAVLWTDSRENKYIEEAGMMNVMFIMDGVLVTPPLSDSILDGITRDSVLTIARDMKIAVEERLISVDELIAAMKKGRLSEAFGAGTAAVIAPIEMIGAYGEDYVLPEIKENAVMFQLKKRLENMRTGIDADIYGWNTIIECKR
ncbi:MAG: branched-chain amino acid aminotransferase [Chitinophagales bacterium]|nr:branched-chain amino acid aminotransferase [Chitinophagales bacterium]